MQFTKMVTENFQGLLGLQVHDLTKKIIIKIGNNGTGKTNFINAFRYGLTGIDPDGEMVTRGKENASVTLYGTDGNVYMRERSKRCFC